MKRISVIGVLLILFLNFSGFYIYFFAQLAHVKKEMRSALAARAAEELVVLKLSIQEYKQAYIEEHEVKVNGKMFDIARQIQHEDEMILYGLYDNEETDLIAWLDELLEQPLHDKTPLPDQVIQFITLSFLPSYYEMVFVNFSNSVSATPYMDICSSFHPCTKVPPPRSEATHYIA